MEKGLEINSVKSAEKNDSNEDIEIRSVEKEKLEEIMKEYEEDPDNFYRKNAHVLWEEGKNPALILTMEIISSGIQDVWEKKNLENKYQAMHDAKNVAMLVAKYLGADIEGWCKVDAATAAKVNVEISENTKENQQDNYNFIMEKVKRNDPVFSELLTKLCVYDPRTGENRSLDEVSVMMEVVVWITKTMYEQMLKNAKIN